MKVTGIEIETESGKAMLTAVDVAKMPTGAAKALHDELNAMFVRGGKSIDEQASDVEQYAKDNPGESLS